MVVDIERAAQDSGAAARQIERLALAAACMADGSAPGDPSLRNEIVIDLLEIIQTLAKSSSKLTNSIEGVFVGRG